MKEFKDLTLFAEHLEKTCLLYEKYEKEAAMFIGLVLEDEAKDKIGHLQDAHGPFPAWAELADSTKLDKEKQGYVFNSDYNPLYREGKLKQSIHHSFVPEIRTIFLGSTADEMVWLEGGTSKMAPRSVIGETMYQAYPMVNYVLGNMLKQWVSGKRLTLRRGTYGSI